MSDSLFSTLLHTLDKFHISEIAGSLGESEQSISRGIDSSIAAVLGGMASKSEDPVALRRTLDLIPGDAGGFSWSYLASGLTNPNSPLIARGKFIMSNLFGNRDGTVTSAVTRECDLGPGTAAKLLAMAAPMVMSFLGKRVRDEGMSMADLGDVLRHESATIRSALPAGLGELILPRYPVGDSASPVIAQPVRIQRGLLSWLPALALCALTLGGLWMWTKTSRPGAEISSLATTGSASRVASEAVDLGKRKLSNTVGLTIPEGGPESRLLVFIQNPDAVVDQTSWFRFDHLTFRSGSATLRPESGEQLDNIAAILAAYPKVHVSITGYTDNMGRAKNNLELSQARADRIKTELVARGVSADRLIARGLGEPSPVAPHENDRAGNRRAALLVTQK